MKLQWFAELNDGKLVWQFDPEREPVEISTDSLPLLEIKNFNLFDEKGKIVFTSYLDPGDMLIYRRRTKMKMGQQEPVEICHLAGSKREENIRAIAFIFERSEKIEMRNGFEEKHPWHYGIVESEREMMKSEKKNKNRKKPKPSSISIPNPSPDFGKSEKR